MSPNKLPLDHQHDSAGRQLYRKRVAVAMSGGVDSAVSAALLHQAGAEVYGVFMRLAQREVDAHQRRAEAVAAYLGVPLTVLDLTAPFRAGVLDVFTRQYRAGLTPNPCVICNRRIKFGLLWQQMIGQKADFLATGHYARLLTDGAGGFTLHRGLDPGKDQSYFLCRLRGERLSRILFPLGAKTKAEVYRRAAVLGLSGHHGGESQDICFLGAQSVTDFLTITSSGATDTSLKATKNSAGIIVDITGRELGRHRGVHGYTIGQRRGLGISDATPYYVVALDAVRKLVIVGKQQDLMQREILICELNWLSAVSPDLPASFLVQLRHRHQPAPALLTPVGDGTFIVHFAEPQRAPAPGQYAALYRKDQLLGGGEIMICSRP
ncbi:MAG: tRNA 2-thiouridine(34) synthase MnmA [Desulfobulbaceae bacterium]|nr:MAG: tRNA 2-thiouridine(34) synthase MnmA [Desulfobulbaceae bacterium]